MTHTTLIRDTHIEAAVLVEPGLIEMQRRRVPPKAIDLVQSRRVDLDAVIAGRFPLERTAEALDADRTPGSVKTVVALS